MEKLIMGMTQEEYARRQKIFHLRHLAGLEKIDRRRTFYRKYNHGIIYDRQKTLEEILQESRDWLEEHDFDIPFELKNTNLEKDWLTEEEKTRYA